MPEKTVFSLIFNTAVNAATARRESTAHNLEN